MIGRGNVTCFNGHALAFFMSGIGFAWLMGCGAFVYLNKDIF
jgi:hypothetical protein